LHRHYFSSDNDSVQIDRADVLVKSACDFFAMQARINGEPLQEYFDSLRRHIVDPIDKEVDQNDPLTTELLAECEQARLDYAAYLRAVNPKDEKTKQKADQAKVVLEEEEGHFLSHLATRNAARSRLVTSSMAFLIQLQSSFYSNLASNYDRLAADSLPGLQTCQLESKAVENRGKAGTATSAKKAVKQTTTSVAPASPAPAKTPQPRPAEVSKPAPVAVAPAAAAAPAPAMVDLDFFGGGSSSSVGEESARAASASPTPVAAANPLFDIDGVFGAAPAAAASAAPSTSSGNDPLAFFDMAPSSTPPASGNSSSHGLAGLDFSADFTSPRPASSNGFSSGSSDPFGAATLAPSSTPAAKGGLDALAAQMANDLGGGISPAPVAAATTQARAASTGGSGTHKAADWSRVPTAAFQQQPQQLHPSQMTPQQQQMYAAQLAAHQQAQWAARYRGSGPQAPAAAAPGYGQGAQKPPTPAPVKYEAPAHYANMESNKPKAPVVDPTDNDLRRQSRAEHAARAEAAGQAKVEELREAEAKQKELLEQKLQLDDVVSARVNAWAGAGGKKNNIRSLLSTMDKVLWDESGWTAVSLSELMDPKKVRRVWLKAVAVVHPDKVQGCEVERQLLAERVFNVLRDSFDSFKSELGQ
jgi:hypothetical protein